MAQTGGGVGTKGVPRADREQQILDAAVAEFGGRGYAHASMAAIARRAGISKPLVYEYFGSKDGLYLACLNRAGTHLVGRVAAAQGGTTLRRAGDTLAAIFSALDGRRLDWAGRRAERSDCGYGTDRWRRGYQGGAAGRP